MAVVAVVLGLLLVYSGGSVLVGYVRSRPRLERAPAVVVGRVDDGVGSHAHSRSYAARFRFITAEGREVEAVSGLSTHPGPKVGRQFTIVYDPADPEGTAERVGARKLQLLLAPLLVIGGAACVAFGVILV